MRRRPGLRWARAGAGRALRGDARLRSALTHAAVRRRFLAHAGRAHLEPDEKRALKRLVERELLQVQVDGVGAAEERPDLAEKAKGPPAPSRGPGRKRFRFDSESGQCLPRRGFMEAACPVRVFVPRHSRRARAAESGTGSGVG